MIFDPINNLNNTKFDIIKKNIFTSCTLEKNTSKQENRREESGHVRRFEFLSSQHAETFVPKLHLFYSFIHFL